MKRIEKERRKSVCRRPRLKAHRLQRFNAYISDLADSPLRCIRRSGIDLTSDEGIWRVLFGKWRAAAFGKMSTLFSGPHCSLFLFLLRLAYIANVYVI